MKIYENDGFHMIACDIVNQDTQEVIYEDELTLRGFHGKDKLFSIMLELTMTMCKRKKIPDLFIDRKDLIAFPKVEWPLLVRVDEITYIDYKDY